MSPSAETRIDLLRLAAELGDDIDAMQRRHAELVALSSRDDAWHAGSPYLSVVALGLHHYYGAVERGLERCVVLFEGKLPAGADWHRDLLHLAALPITGVRPAILTKASEGTLAEVMRFRHFLRHAYAADLEPSRLRALTVGLLAGHPQVRGDLDRFCEHVRRGAEALGDA